MLRALILVHRYLGIAIGLVMAMWCLSGIVMLYERYPELDEEHRLQALESLDWRGCCAVDQVAAAIGVDVVDEFVIEMVAGRPILRTTLANGEQRAFDLRTGSRLSLIDARQAVHVAMQFTGVSPSEPRPTHSELIERDQWTVSGQFNADRPLHRIALHDPQRTEVYVSSKTGAVVQHTTARQRFWNWLGSVPHWLYPTVLRQHVHLWSQLVIALSLVGTFLTVLGIYIGIDRWRAMQGRKLSPYRAIGLWHHVSGLFFWCVLINLGREWIDFDESLGAVLEFGFQCRT